MQLVVTIHEQTPEIAIDVIRAIHADHDVIEVRADAFANHLVDWSTIRKATAKPVIATNRGGGHVDIDAALGAGIDFLDMEWPEVVDGERVVLSHHDYDGMPDVNNLLRQMRATHVKIAATPHNFADNARLLAALGEPATTIIGMGARGLYSRILAPFFGSEFQFVSVDEERSAAPGQLTLEQALAIYGPNRGSLKAEKIFAIVGNPAAHSGSPAIHNAIFREQGIAAAYSIFETDDFLDVAAPFARGGRFTPDGLSVTAPFKEDALLFAESVGADIRHNAREAGAVNTLVRIRNHIVADNTDVNGFETLIAKSNARTAAVIGAGGTARAAIIALRRAGIEATVFNRTAGKLDALPLDQLAAYRGDLVINTLPRNVGVTLPNAGTIIEAAYGGESHATFNGLDLLRAQAVRQSELFLEACR
ncbi:MAG TPA: type I 3-dehydroquinate dehydratase [Thermoanaerobaculia bacterium]|jgi:3-dehydroquinate dehydratase type I|nr:type I 3-dehydroquinate dehydratase [Thermoanaerobaculia bacterium]